jgi:hypothetical protein
LTAGRAAKLINLYLKTRFVCAGHHFHDNVKALHPPIDRELLSQLASADVAGLGQQWREARDWAWTKFTSDQYEHVIGLVRTSVRGRPLWTIEEHWGGI